MAQSDEGAATSRKSRYEANRNARRAKRVDTLQGKMLRKFQDSHGIPYSKRDWAGKPGTPVKSRLVKPSDKRAKPLPKPAPKTSDKRVKPIDHAGLLAEPSDKRVEPLPKIETVLPAPRTKFQEPKSYSNLPEVLAAIRKSGGAASANRYEVLIHPPFTGRGGSLDDSPLFTTINKLNSREIEDVSIKCESINLPGRNLNSTPDVTIHGPRREVVEGATFDDAVEMIFTASPDMRERVFFEKWQHAAFNQDTWNVNFYWDYVGEVDIYLLDNSGPKANRMYGLRLYECFPKTIAASALSYITQNEVIKITVSMNFRYWKSLDLSLGENEIPAAYPANAF